MAERNGRKQARAVLLRSGYKAGGHVTPKSDEAQDRKMIAAGVHKHEGHLHKGEPKTKFSSGGLVSGSAPKTRLDKLARGGKPKSVTNIIIGHPGATQPPAIMPRPPMPGPAAMPPTGAGPTPPMRRGGTVKRKDGGGVKGPHMTAGAATGEGREEKAERYGKRDRV